ncbi:MAG TPA: uracil-DNA glycosylase [Nitrospiria bacterium]|jgi:DNA polymerase
MKLKQYYEQIKDCQLCDLSKTRTHLVFGEGNPNARIVFVGEAPGKNEDLQGKPFVGAAGKILTQLLESIGLKRDDIYIANVLKCRPPENRNPKPEEIETCIPHLWKQLELIQPKVVCTLGNFATQTLLGKKIGISKVRGKYFQVKDSFVFPMYHPAATLHQGGLREVLKEDFKTLRDFINQSLEPNPDSVKYYV